MAVGPYHQGAETEGNATANPDLRTARRSGLGAGWSLRAADLLPRRHALCVLGISHQERASPDLARAADAAGQSLAAVAPVPGLRRRHPLHARQVPRRLARPCALGEAACAARLRHVRDRAAAGLLADRREPWL